MNLTKILSKVIIIPITLGFFSSPLYASFNAKEGSRYEQFMKHDDGDRVLYFNEYLVDFIDKGKQAFEKAMNDFDVYDKDDNWIIDKEDKRLNGE